MINRKNIVEQTTLYCGASTHVGKVRKNNQDAFGFNDYLFVVADGMGGHLGGEVASDLAVTTLTKTFELSGKIRKKKVKRNQSGLLHAVERANNRIIEKASDNTSLKGMGTTLCAVMIGIGEDQNPALLITNVGDSRIYQLSVGKFNQITEDHSLVADLVRAGELTPEEAARHPQRNVLTRALGIESNLKADMWELSINDGDKFLLCSDGLFNELSETRIMEILSEASDPQTAADLLVNESVEVGGHDNVTAMVLTVESTLKNRIKIQSQNTETSSQLKKEKRNRKINWRITGFFVTLSALIGIGIGSMWLYAHRGWYVGEHRGQVEIFEGRPEGFLWFEPRVHDIDGPSIATLRELDQSLVLEVIEVSSRQEAEDVVNRLEQRSDG